MSSHTNAAYAFQYQEAFNLLYRSDAPVDTIALPMVYCLRHYIELVLKANIYYFQEFSGSNNMVGKSGHKIKPFMHGFLEHWTLVKKNFNLKVDDQKYIDDLKKLVDVLDELDPVAISFRYSNDLKKNKNFEWIDTIDIHNLHLLVQSASIFLNESISVFEDSTGLINGVTKEELLKSMDK